MFPLLPTTLNDEPVAAKVTATPALIPIVICLSRPVKAEPLPTKLVAVITPAFPNFILLPTSIDAAESPDECRFEEPVLKFDAEDIPVVLT